MSEIEMPCGSYAKETRMQQRSHAMPDDIRAWMSAAAQQAHAAAP